MVSMVDGQALKEYCDDSEQVEGNEVVRYIEAVSGKEFSVKVDVNKDFNAKGDVLSVDVYADGMYVTGRNLHIDVHPEHTWTALGFETPTEISHFRFDEFETGWSSRLLS